MKKLLLIVLCFVLCFAFIIPAYATDGYVDEIGNVTTGLTENTSSTGTASYEIITGTQYHLYSYARAYFVFDGVAPLKWANTSSDKSWSHMNIVGSVDNVAAARYIYKFNESKEIEKIKVHLPTLVAAGVGPYVTLNAQYSDDGFTWTTVKTITCDPVSTGEDEYDLIFEDVNTGSHIYWAVLCESYGYEFGSVSEIYMFSFDGSFAGSEDTEYQDSILGWFQRLFDAMKSIPQKLSDLGETIGNFFDTLRLNIESFFDNLWNNIVSFFTPDTDKISEQFNSLYDKFDFVHIVVTIIKDIGDLFNETPKPPVIKINISNNDSNKYIPEGDYVLLDLSWYSRFKPKVDDFLSVFLWLGYIWILFKRLPDIISGAGMITDMQSTISFREYRNSYSYYKENRDRNSEYAARYNSEHKRGG